MRRMHSIQEQHRLVRVQMVQQVLVLLDEGRLLLGIELARYRLWLAMLHAEAVQQGNQAGAALIRNAAFLLDPGADLTGRPRQRLSDPRLQLVLLFNAQAAGTSFVAEAGQTLDPVFLIQLSPFGSASDTSCGRCRRPTAAPWRSLRSSCLRPAGPARWPVVPGDAPQTRPEPVRSGLGAMPGRGSQDGSCPQQNPARAFGKRFVRVPTESGYTCVRSCLRSYTGGPKFRPISVMALLPTSLAA